LPGKIRHFHWAKFFDESVCQLSFTFPGTLLQLKIVFLSSWDEYANNASFPKLRNGLYPSVYIDGFLDSGILAN